MSRSRSLCIKSEQTEDVAVLQCVGRIVRGEALLLLKNVVTSLSRMRVIMLDLAGVEMLDCGGLGMLVSLHSWTRNNGIQFKLVDPSNFAREMFRRTGLTCVLHVSSVGDALDVLRKPDSGTENVNRVDKCLQGLRGTDRSHFGGPCRAIIARYSGSAIYEVIPDR